MSDPRADEIAAFGRDFSALKDEIQKEIVGYDDLVSRVVTCLFAGGHVLLEGVPGLGKTLLVRTLAKALDLRFSRIQFSPDLMPADIVGTQVLVTSPDGNKEFRFQPGPVFANIVLADEINRTTPKTQAALLEAMQEHSVTVGGTTHTLDQPFFVLGTQNPIDMEGTYPLPEAQVDRFLFKLRVGYLDEASLLKVIDRTTSTEVIRVEPVLAPDRIRAMRSLVREVATADHVKRYAVRLATSTHPESEHAPEIVRRYVKFGASPRGILGMILAGKVRALCQGRINLAGEDLRWALHATLRHRLILNFEGEAEGLTTDTVLDEVVASVNEEALARTS
ncbi:MAG: AAA family ATPase [Planctomycetes bacterium]|nr:AAA family ATPase [Planctomycetota bacterium]